MTEIADKIRSLKVINHIDFMLLGDPLRSIFLPMWGNSTDLPDVYQKVIDIDSNKIVLNIWNLNDNTDATHRMFPLDGTINTGFDYCIIIYDAISRKKAENLDLWLSIKDQISSRQHKDRTCDVIVIVAKTSKTEESLYKNVTDYCNKHNINIIMINNSDEDFTNLRDLTEKLSNLIYNKRKNRVSEKIKEILGHQEKKFLP